MIIRKIEIRKIAKGMKNFNRTGWKKPLLPPQSLKHTTVRLPLILFEEFEKVSKLKFGVSTPQNAISVLIANFLCCERGR